MIRSGVATSVTAPAISLAAMYLRSRSLMAATAGGLLSAPALGPVAPPASCGRLVPFARRTPVAFGIDEGVGLSLLEKLVPFHHAVIAAVRTEKHIAGKALEDLEGLGEVGRRFPGNPCY